MVRRHPVLASVSTCYSRDRDKFLTCYAPVRHSVFRSLATAWTSFDLHVLSTPPAFVLSQDQTLHREPVRDMPGTIGEEPAAERNRRSGGRRAPACDRREPVAHEIDRQLSSTVVVDRCPHWR